MKKSFKRGFTLIEVLVAMAIVGTVAALVIPPLVSGTQAKRHATSLGRSVENIETGCQALVQNINELSDDGAFDGYFLISPDMDGTMSSTPAASIMANSAFLSYLANYIDLTPLTDEDKEKYINSVHAFNGDTASPGIANIAENFVLSPKLGAYYGVKSFKVSEEDEDYEYWYNLVYIDVNGPSGPNRYGMDIFLFNLTNNCHMVPAGTPLLSQLSIPVETEACAGKNVTNGLSCTSRVVKDGYKIEYRK